MIKSSLATEVYPALAGNYAKGRNGKRVCKITPHHMAGVMTARQCGAVFQKQGRLASSNYGIGNDGEIACYVGEEDRAYTSYSKSNDSQAITIEVSNCETTSGQWKISDKAWNSLIELCVDICRRYNFRLVYDGTPNGSLTRHNMFQKTTCPGPYLQSRFPELARIVNSRLDGNSSDSHTDNNSASYGLDASKEEKPMFVFRNGKTVEPIYADTAHTVLIGSLNKWEVCECFGIYNGAPMVRYQVGNTGNYKVGFAVDTRCVKNS